MVCVCVCVCVRACVRFYKQESDVVCSSKTNERTKKASTSSSSSREVELDCFVAVFVLEQELQKERERERERDADLFFGFFHFFAKRAGRRKKRSCSTFPSHKKKRATMADVQHERGYQKQVGVNVG